MRNFQLFDLVVPIIIGFLIFDTWFIYKMDKERPPLIPITVECMSSTGETFHTDIGISFEEIGHMQYRILDYNRRYTDFNGFCSASQVKK